MILYVLIVAKIGKVGLRLILKMVLMPLAHIVYPFLAVFMCVVRKINKIKSNKAVGTFVRSGGRV